MEGKKQYDRQFLMKLQTDPLSMAKPSNLPSDIDIVLDAPVKLNVQTDWMPGFMKNSDVRVSHFLITITE